MKKSIKNELNWEEKPSKCSKCGGSLEYRGRGEYHCTACGNIERDDFGKVYHYIEENGPSSGIIISEATGVNIDKINKYLRQGRIEIPDGSPVYIKCERCGTDIRYGRFCPACALSLSKQIQGAFEVGEVPKHKATGDNYGQMRFIGKEKNKK